MNIDGDALGHDSTGPVMPVSDDAPPLIIQSEREVFHEKDGADFAVTEFIAKIRATGARLQFHVASVRNGKTGTVCVAQKNGENGVPTFLIARHWRVSTKQWAWEFPRGMELDDEDAVATAIRELQEETGLKSSRDQITILQHIHADTGMLRDDIAVAKIRVPDTSTTPLHGDWELANDCWVTADTLQRMITAGEITDGITLASWTVFQAHTSR